MSSSAVFSAAKAPAHYPADPWHYPAAYPAQGSSASDRGGGQTAPIGLTSRGSEPLGRRELGEPTTATGWVIRGLWGAPKRFLMSLGALIFWGRGGRKVPLEQQQETSPV